MEAVVKVTRLTQNRIADYISTGTKAYNQHYTHLWEEGDSSPYVQSSFATGVLERELAEVNSEHCVIDSKDGCIGILKLMTYQNLEPYQASECLLLEKIYLLKNATGRGFGKQVLQFVERRAEELGKKMVWLDTMKNGPALSFYLQNGFDIHSETKLGLPGVIEERSAMYQLVKRL